MENICAWCGQKFYDDQPGSFPAQLSICCSEWCTSIIRRSLGLRNPARLHKFEKRYKFERDRKALECSEGVQASEYRMGLNDLYSPKRLIIRRRDGSTVVKGLEWSGGSPRGSKN